MCREKLRKVKKVDEKYKRYLFIIKYTDYILYKAISNIL